MSRVRVCFLGTPSFALTCLKALFSDEHFEVVGVISQPDRPAGRKMLLTPSAVKTFALSHHLPIITPESLRKETFFYDEIRKWRAELAVVVAYGQILSEEFLKLFPLGAVNVHASILPRWRGAAPIQRSIQHGDLETGVSLQKVVKKLDAGDVIGERRMVLNQEVNALELHDQLAVLGCELLHVELMDFVRGNLMPNPQDESLVTIAPKISNDEARIEWNQPALVVHNKVRAFCLGPGTFTLFDSKKMKIHRTQMISAGMNLGAASPGEVSVHEAESRLFVKCQDQHLEILELQPESKQKMFAKDFIRGYLHAKQRMEFL